MLGGVSIMVGVGWLVLGEGGGTAPRFTGALEAGASEAPLRAALGEAARPRRVAQRRRAREREAALPPPVDLRKPDALGSGFGRSRPAAGLLFNLDSGRVLWRHNPRARRSIASLTKIMSALVVVDRIRVGERVAIGERSAQVSGSRVGLRPGRQIPAESLLDALLIQSGNDAALALATAASGGVHRFVEEMNDRARELGLGCTRFVSPHGLQPQNRSCPEDLARLAQLAMARPRITRAVAKNGAAVPLGGGSRRLDLFPTNPLLRSGYRGTIGLKTGYTEEAGACLIAVVKRGSQTLVAVLLDSPDPGGQAERLFDRAFGER